LLQAGTIVCPMDRQITDVGGGGVWDLKKNFALIELMEKLQLGAVSCSSSTDHVQNSSSSAQSSKVGIWYLLQKLYG